MVVKELFKILWNQKLLENSEEIPHKVKNKMTKECQVTCPNVHENIVLK